MELEKLLLKMKYVRLQNLDIHIAGSLFDQISDSYLKSYEEVYLLAKKRLIDEVTSNKIPKEFTQRCKILFLSDRNLFEELHGGKTVLPEWVSGYVDIPKLSLLKHIEKGLVIPKKIKTTQINSYAHEFVHLLTPLLLDIPANKIKGICPSWFGEILTVWLNQNTDSKWLAEQINISRTSVNLNLIKSLGFFGIDKNRPETNIAYQYAAHFGYNLGRELAKTSKAKPMEALSNLLIEAYEKNIDVESLLIQKEIYLDTIEQKMRRDYGIC